MIEEVDLVQLGLACAETCQDLDRALRGVRREQLCQSVIGAIERLNM